MRKWLPAIAILIVAAGAILLFNRPPQPISQPQSAPVTAPVAQTADSELLTAPPVPTLSNRAAIAITPATQHKPVARLDSYQPTTPVVNLPEPTVPIEDLPKLPPETVIENVRAAFRNFRARFASNPVGTNEEITRALNGQNPGQSRFLRMEDGMRINAKGELIDTWGTPYFFHQLSGTEMEIHCAGSDKVMWTSDDLVIK